VPATQFALYIGKFGVGIRKDAAYPGERTGQSIKSGQAFEFDDTVKMPHTDSDGKTHDITFFNLSDGRGWAHDFCPDKDDEKQIQVMVSKQL
jgi:hypothetical protein